MAMLKEHNELLVRQAKLHQAKLQDLLRSYQSRGKLRLYIYNCFSFVNNLLIVIHFFYLKYLSHQKE